MSIQEKDAWKKDAPKDVEPAASDDFEDDIPF